MHKVDNYFILYCRTNNLLSFIIENTILFSDAEWNTKDPIEKLTCNKIKSWLYPWDDDEWLHKFHSASQIEDGLACIAFSLFPKRSIKFLITIRHQHQHKNKISEDIFV